MFERGSTAVIDRIKEADLLDIVRDAAYCPIFIHIRRSRNNDYFYEVRTYFKCYMTSIDIWSQRKFFYTILVVVVLLMKGSYYMNAGLQKMAKIPNVRGARRPFHETLESFE